MDGLRRSMTADFNRVCREVSDLPDSDEKQKIISALQELRQEVGALNCIRNPDDKDFNFLTDLKVYDFEPEEEKEA